MTTLTSRYSVLSVPVFLCAYFAWMLYGRTAGKHIPGALFVVALAASVVNVQSGRQFGFMRRVQAEALQRDVERGVPPEELASRHDHGSCRGIAI